MVAISRVWQASWQRPRQWCWFLAGVAVLTGGFHYRILPASNIVTSQGTLLAALAVAVGCFCAVLAAAWAWLLWRPAESAGDVVERTCLSLMFASMLSVWACIGPIGGTFYAHGRFVRLAIWFIGFGVLQLAWMLKWDQHLKHRLPHLWRARDLISWPDAILAASLAVFAAEMLTYFDRPYIQITPFALVMNIALLTFCIIALWGAFGRGLFAVALAWLAFFVLSFANAQKLKHLNVGLQPGDQTYLGELLYFKEFFQPEALALAGACLVGTLGMLVWAWRRSVHRPSMRSRARMFAGGACAFLAVGTIPWLPGSNEVLRHLGVIEETWDSHMSVKRNGLLVELALQLPESYFPEPPGYGPAEVARIVAQRVKYSPPVHPTPQPSQPASLMVFFFEALTNPADFGRPLTREVVPNFRQLQAAGLHGYAITPRFANGSAESEFALLTGMSCSFLPPNSCAYKHFMKRPTPSLVTMLRNQYGHRSTAVKCVTPDFYNFNEAYQHLQFDRFCSQGDFVHPTYDKFSTHMSDSSFIEEMLRPLARPPAFIVGENLGSHAPYHAHLMGDKPRFLVEPSNPANDQIETYLQAISRTDDALGQLVAELKKRPDPVVLLVVGDHHPPLAADSHAYDIPAFQVAGPAGELFRRRVPFAVWKNFAEQDMLRTFEPGARHNQLDTNRDIEPQQSAAQQPESDQYISMHFLSLLMLREAGIEPQGLIAWNQELFELCPVVSRDLFYADGQAKTWQELSPAIQQRIQDYQLLQYDLLLGENYGGVR